ncbi:MAG: LapA family protein [Deltaproteobacteria bacterium]|nr:MAG: LapA family protein [Deltaproteobacteria bacterium]
MRKIFSAIFLSLVIFIILNFLYSNLNEEVFNYPMSFRFSIPYLFTLKSEPVPLGLVVITAFCLGIIFLALLQAIPALFKSIAVRSRDKRIRELERELEAARLPLQESVRPTLGS